MSKIASDNDLFHRFKAWFLFELLKEEKSWKLDARNFKLADPCFKTIKLKCSMHKFYNTISTIAVTALSIDIIDMCVVLYDELIQN